jgi:hypothetical protein
MICRQKTIGHATFLSVILETQYSFRVKIRCNPDKAHFSQIIKSKVRMNRMNLFYLEKLFRFMHEET